MNNGLQVFLAISSLSICVPAFCEAPAVSVISCQIARNVQLSRLGGLQFIDVRSPAEFESEHIAGASEEWMEFFLNASEATEAMKGVTAEHLYSMARAVPPAIEQLDRDVQKLILNVLRSDKGTSLAEHFEQARNAVSLDSSHTSVSYVFRSQYRLAWCRELWRFTLTRDSKVRLDESALEFRRRCPKCRSPYGYRLPEQDAAGKWIDLGDRFETMVVKPEIQMVDNRTYADLKQMRANGDFDEAIRAIVTTLKELRLTMMDYTVYVDSFHELSDGRRAVASIDQLSALFRGMQPGEDYPTLLRHSRQYYRPCDVCKGAGCV